jgi:D-alanyl-D-alanine carboxypeptidase (penicillin-binding protein 5/6)
MVIKHFLTFLLTTSVYLYGNIDRGELDALKINALIVKDMKAKHVVYSKEGDKRVSPASLTKVLTAVLAIKSGKMNHRVTITREMTKVEPTIANYKRGDVIVMSDLVKAMMIKSDNDAAKAIAISVGGTEENFIVMMNRYAHSIGMRNSHFSNPCGYDGDDHYTTPNDLLKLTEFAIRNSTFNAICALNEHTYYSQNNHKKFYAYTHNRLLNRYEYAVGVKTGYTNKAGQCLIARAKKDGKDFVIVMMHSKEDRWKTAKNIFEQVLNS